MCTGAWQGVFYKWTEGNSRGSSPGCSPLEFVYTQEDSDLRVDSGWTLMLIGL